MVGAQATVQGHFSKFKRNIPHCCSRNPAIVDLPPGVPKNQQFSQCCKDGELASWGEDPAASVSSFQLSVGLSGTWNITVRLPKNFYLLGPGPDDTGLFHGIKYYNDLLPEAGPHGNVQSDLIFQKDKNAFTLERGWAFPLQVYFNGNECMIPPPDAYPFLHNAAHAVPTVPASLLIILLVILLLSYKILY
ncbi:hypothetical protein Dsin_005369 [Dipteronia sinensis]|uniref:COBRA-like protein n=1 Tax=Dipteronia sinensis TaxID=43782 RepID=A0AAE0AXQ4_9ROSI|nr:hypothetical protein Dsin_005369 [Dipteronia sinensis]